MNYFALMEFRWNEWNFNHIAKHGVAPSEAEDIVREARPPYPLRREDEKWLVFGRGSGGRLLQVIFVYDEDGTVYVIHSRPMTDREKQQYRNRHRL